MPTHGGALDRSEWIAAVSVEPVVALRALEHQEYCARQCALIHGDGVWVHSEHTLRGIRDHRRVDDGQHRTERGRRVLRGIPLWSERWGLTGRADVVELHADGSVVPVEYKSGSRHGLAADVQLCAQALCLEEMLAVTIDHGFVWFGGPRRRERVACDTELRTLTLGRIAEIRANLLTDQLPMAPNDVRCTECPLRPYCLPEVVTVDQDELRRSTTEELFTCAT